MFVPFWLIFLGSGLVMAAGTVVWAIRSGQFDDQQRARFIPLAGLSGDELTREPTRRRRSDYAGVFTMLFVGVGAILAALALVVGHGTM